MGCVIMTEDTETFRTAITNALTEEGHEVLLARGDTMREMVDNAVRLADEHPGFVLELDFNLRYGPADGEIWGGIWLYVGMRDRGALEKCRGVVIGSRYINKNVRALKSARTPVDAFIARVFVELERIPDENIFKMDAGCGIQEMAKRISKIFQETDLRVCNWCGREME
jgi:hypothetical protein